ncbi:MAG TPA: Holliday junction resolvase RecU [Candidatus Jeotgalibaca pullicola]|nr:Holliday junction resolvase RecU [Candidatus Jeotgalibaca pullicola]
MNYPNGKIYKKTDASDHEKKKTKTVQYGKRGMTLEEEINQSNQFYLERDIAVIHKKPTPIQVVKVDYPKRSAAVIREAYYRQSSTTDFNGVYKGFYLDFEAKETKNKQSFPLKNFHEHQIFHMDKCQKQGGIAFVLICFSIFNRVFLLESEYLSMFWNNQKKAGSRKSIPLSFIEENGYEIQYGFQPSLHYLGAVDQIIKNKK